MPIRKTCPKCTSKDLSKGTNDFLIVNGIEEPIQWCNYCHEEWYVEGEQ